MENTVLAVRCETYDPGRLEGLVAEGMRHLGYSPSGKVFAKPNVVFAYTRNPYGAHAYTHPAVVGSSLLCLARERGVSRVDLGENSAVGIPTRFCYRYAGYYEEIRRVRALAPRPVGIFCIDEEPRDSVFVGGRVHDNLRLSRRMARADSVVYLPKLKCHCVSNMTGAVKLNIGICSDDERSIRHDFLLNEKIADLLTVGRPDFVVMDAVEVGVGNEAVPTPRNLGLLLMGRNPVAVDLVAARLLGLGLADVPYLQKVVERGFTPSSLEEVRIDGDLRSIDDLDAQARRVLPYDDAFHRWQDVSRELERLRSPIRFFWGPYSRSAGERCLTGCVMGLKMFLAFFEQYAGADAFARAKPVSFVVGRYAGEVDGRGHEVFLIGSCADARVVNASRITRMDKCFTTAGDMMQSISLRLGMPSPFMDKVFLVRYLGSVLRACLRKTLSLRYLQDVVHFLTRKLLRRV